MSENSSRFTYSEKQYMLKILAFLDSLIIKSEYDMRLSETAASKAAGELYVLAKNERDTIFNYTLSYANLVTVGISEDMRALFEKDKSAFYERLSAGDTELLVTYLRKKTIDEYIEVNPYYLLLNGEPSSEAEYVMVKDIYTNEMIPLHKFSDTYHPKMYAYLMNYDSEQLNLIISEQRAAGRNYEYFDHMMCRVPYHVSRAAKNFEILYADTSVLSGRDTHNFYASYYNARDYVLTVPYIKEYSKTQELYDRYMGVIVLFIALLNFLVSRVDTYIRNEFSTNEDRRTFFKEHDMESLVDSLTESQMQSLMANIDQLIQLKGSDEVIIKILDLFGIDNIDIYKLVLLKYINADAASKDIIIDPKKPRSENYDISLVKVPLEESTSSKSLSKYLSDKNQHTDFKSVVLKDKYFGGTHLSTADLPSNPKIDIIADIEDKLKNTEEFSYLYTKYLGILTHVNITQSLIEATYLFATIMRDETILDTTISFSAIGEFVTIRELFCAINYITTLRSGISDDIVTTVDGIASIMGFNTTPDIEELRSMKEYVIPITSGDVGDMVELRLPKIINEEDIFIVDTPVAMSSNQEYDTDIDAVKSYYSNISKHDKLLEKMYTSTDYNEYIACQKIFNYNMYCKSAIDMFQGYTNYSTYLRANRSKLYDYIIVYLNSSTDSMWEDVDGEYTSTFIEACINLIAEFIDKILKSLNLSQDLQNAINESYLDNTSTFAKIFTVINIFKSYTTEFSNTDTVYTINNKKDCLVKALDLLTGEHMSDMSKETLYDLISYEWNVSMESTENTNIRIRHALREYANRQSLESPIEITDLLAMLGFENLYHGIDVMHSFQQNSVTDVLGTDPISGTLLVDDHSPTTTITVRDDLIEITE